MIRHAWRDRLAPDEQAQVAELLRSAVAYDEEAGFSTALVPDGGQGGEPTGAAGPIGAAERVEQLVVTLLPREERGSAAHDHLPEGTVVAYLRADVDAGGGALVQLVVRPELRSLGVSTLLLEQLSDPDRDDGWASRGIVALRAWSHGRHPAAERMSRRFAATRSAEVFKVLRAVGGSRPFRDDGVDRDAPGDPAIEPVDGERLHGTRMPEEHLATLAPVDRETRGRRSSLITSADVAVLAIGADADEPARRTAVLDLLGDVELDRAELRRVLVTGLLRIQEQGARLGQLYVDASDRDLVSVSRNLGFVHDQSDVLYRADATQRAVG
ncbi:hypothetical protein [Nocardioides zeae]|uniref:Uncharacterized protein n=1 Tax=Nocardioides zeae TaxID=1457234 RepID=A0A6P0HGR5_9ACTN|nr:hypothetical protein [Nocardioides zeae]NEN77882.1 hypothetical protein [Nocardioides zeae]